MTTPTQGRGPRTAARNLRRVLLYTHNSIGMGHVVRCLAVIEGMRAARPGLEFLVLTGSRLPELFLAEGVEVLRLPGLRQDLDADQPSWSPRLLKSLSAAELAGLRRGVIAQVLAGYGPDAVLVEHYPAGLLGEASPLLGLEGHGPRPRRHALALLCRDQPRQPYAPDQPLPGLERLLGAYDFIYVLDHPAPGAAAADTDNRLCHLGPVTCRLPGELPTRAQAMARLGLGPGKLILLSLGRGGAVPDMARAILAALPAAGLADHQAALVVDPYLEPAAAASLRGLAREAGALALPFVPRLVEVLAAADLVVCRAGHNTVNELLMTGAPALVLPERHASGEQERRCRNLAAGHVLVASPERVMAGGAVELLRRLARLERGAPRAGFDRHAVGARLVADLEAWLGGDRRVETS